MLWRQLRTVASHAGFGQRCADDNATLLQVGAHSLRDRGEHAGRRGFTPNVEINKFFSNQPLRMARASPARTISGFGDRHDAKRLPGINSKDNEGCAGCPIAHGCCEKWRARSMNMGTIASPWRYEGPSGPAKGHAGLATGRRRHYAESPKLRLRPVWARGGPVLSSAVVAAGRPARGSGRAISAPSPCSAPSCREELHKRDSGCRGSAPCRPA
jgi:hypothetical protein